MRQRVAPVLRFRNGRLQQKPTALEHTPPNAYPDENNTPRTALAKRRRTLIRRVGIGLLLLLLVTIVHFVAHVSLRNMLLSTIMGAYILYTEFYRLQPERSQVAALHAQVRKLVEARREAGLMRLEQEVTSRQQHWCYPPHSAAAVILRGRVGSTSASSASRGGREGGKEHRFRSTDRELDYRTLCVATMNKLEGIALDRRKTGQAVGASSLYGWMFSQLAQAGPMPGHDYELYRLMHTCLDEVDDHPPGERDRPRSSIESPTNCHALHDDHPAHCRLCLGLQTKAARSRTVTLQCKHLLCEQCVQRVLEDAFAGNMEFPVACPVGCAVGGNAHTGTLAPEQVQHLLSEDQYERFSRLHQVATKLGQSAPHSRSRELSAALAHARSRLPNINSATAGSPPLISPAGTSVRSSRVKSINFDHAMAPSPSLHSPSPGSSLVGSDIASPASSAD